MSEQGRTVRRVDLEGLRGLLPDDRRLRAGWVSIAEVDLEALLAVVDAARPISRSFDSDGYPVPVPQKDAVRLRVALEPFTPAEEPDHAELPFDAPTVGSNLEFNERMQERDRARRLADLGIVVNVPQSGPAPVMWYSEERVRPLVEALRQVASLPGTLVDPVARDIVEAALAEWERA